jgi:predicted permease
MSARITPPRSARALIERALPAELRETVCADLDELFEQRVRRTGPTRARLWYAGQALAFVARFAWERRRERNAAQPQRGGGVRASLVDWKLGFRMLVKYPGLSVIAGLALATGIGIGAGMFHFTMMELRPDLGLDEGDRIVRIDVVDGATMSVDPRSLYEFLSWKGELASIRELGASHSATRNIVGNDGRALPELVAEITASAFPLTRVPPLLGRTLMEADEQPGGTDVVVLGYGVWQNRFAGDPSIVGRDVQIGRTRATVVGVMPEGFAFPRIHQAWMPLRVAQPPEPRGGPSLIVFGRMADGASLRSAESELRVIGERMAASNPDTHALLQPRVLPFAAPSIAGPGWFELLTMNLIGMLVLVALCANVASLMFARTALRESEVVVRTALGASRGRIIGQMMVEVLVLALISAAVGLGALNWLLDYAQVNSDRPAFWRSAAFDLDPTTVVYAVGLAVLGSALVAILPALKATGSRVQEGLKTAAGASTNMRFGRLWSGIIVLQVAVTVVALPVGVSFVLDAIREYRALSVFPTSGYLTFRTAYDGDAVGEQATEQEVRDRTAQVFSELERRLEGEPGVAGVTFADGLPGMFHYSYDLEVQRGSEAPQPVVGNLEDGKVFLFTPAPDLLEVFQIPVIAGRGLHDGDVGAANGPILVNESFAEKVGGAPLGLRVRFAASGDQAAGDWHEIVGVVRNLGTDPTGQGEADYVYQPVAFADLRDPIIAVRVNGDAAPLAAKLETTAAQIDPSFRIHEVATFDEVIRAETKDGLLVSLTATGVNVLCILLSAASLFAVMAVGVARRSREVGIRLALGASKRGVLAALFARAAKQLGAGVVVGNIVFVALLVHYDQLDAQSLASLLGVSLLMGFVGLLACAMPARRALRIHPTQALRE